MWRWTRRSRPSHYLNVKSLPLTDSADGLLPIRIMINSMNGATLPGTTLANRV